MVGTLAHRRIRAADPTSLMMIPLLLDYLYWLRDRVLALARDATAAGWPADPMVNGRDLRATLAHEIDVEASWRNKLLGLPIDRWGPAAEVKPDEFPTLDALRTRWAEEERAMRDWLDGLDAEALAASTTVNGLDGRPMSTYVLHVLSHGIGELFVAAAILRELGHDAGDIGLLESLHGREL
jgi:uncharacterized damage-inducible protein DinB